MFVFDTPYKHTFKEDMRVYVCVRLGLSPFVCVCVGACPFVRVYIYACAFVWIRVPTLSLISDAT